MVKRIVGRSNANTITYMNHTEIISDNEIPQNHYQINLEYNNERKYSSKLIDHTLK